LPFHLQVDADPDADPDPAYHFYGDADLFDADPDSEPLTKMMRIHADPDADPDPQRWCSEPCLS
jgi:hypothetical protein